MTNINKSQQNPQSPENMQENLKSGKNVNPSQAQKGMGSGSQTAGTQGLDEENLSSRASRESSQATQSGFGGSAQSR